MEIVLARADAIIVATQAYADSSEVLARYRDKCRIIPFGLDLDDAIVTPDVGARDMIRARHAARSWCSAWAASSTTRASSTWCAR